MSVVGMMGILIQAHFCDSTYVLLKGGRKASSKPLYISDTLASTSVQTQFQVLEIAGELQANDVVLGERAFLDGTRGSIAQGQSQMQKYRWKHAGYEDWNVGCDAIVLMDGE